MLSKTLHSPFFTTILKRGFKMSATNNDKPTLRYLDEFPGRKTCTTGEYLARRLEQIGATSYFAVPGDFTLCLLDELLKIKNLRFVGCCNELNAGYAADGYSRVSKRLGVAVVTYCVGGLSLVNAVAGGFSDDLPMLIVSGGPNTNDAAQGHIIHHTIGLKNFAQSVEVFKPVTHKTFVITHPNDITRMIDQAIFSAISAKKPVYLEIPCNLSKFEVPEPTPFNFAYKPTSDPGALKTATMDIQAYIAASVKPVLIGGVHLRSAESRVEFTAFANKLQCGVALMPDAKSLFSESHPLYMGHYWPSVSSPFVSEVVESADLLIFVGPIMNDYNTTGWTALLPVNKRIEIQPTHVRVCGCVYNGVLMHELLTELARDVPSRPHSLQTYKRLSSGRTITERVAPEDTSAPLTLDEIRRQVQMQLRADTELVVETGDSWFIGQDFKIPDGLNYHVQMQYGSIGWSVGAVLGAALAAEDQKRQVLALIGDGSLQVTAQELSTIIRQGVKATIILLNNNGYTIEVEIHDGPYNDIQNWDYAELINVFNGMSARSKVPVTKSDDDPSQLLKEGCGKKLPSQLVPGLGIRVTTSSELTDALRTADAHNGLTLIECVIARDDCTSELLLWGAKVAAANARPLII